MLLHLEICQQSRLWECGNPEVMELTTKNEHSSLAERSGRFATIAESLANVEALFLSRSLL